MSILNSLGNNRFELSADNYFSTEGSDPSYTLADFAADDNIHPTDDICVTLTVYPADDSDPSYCDICDDSSTGPTFTTDQFVRTQGCLSHLPAADAILKLI